MEEEEREGEEEDAPPEGGAEKTVAEYGDGGATPIVLAERGRQVAGAWARHQDPRGFGTHSESGGAQVDAVCAADPVYQAGVRKARELHDEGIFTAAEFQKEIALLAQLSRERNGKRSAVDNAVPLLRYPANSVGRDRARAKSAC